MYSSLETVAVVYTARYCLVHDIMIWTF